MFLLLFIQVVLGGPVLDRLIRYLEAYEHAAGHPIPHSCNPNNTLVQWTKKPSTLDFVHIPKCGGTTFDTVMRNATRAANSPYKYLTAQKCYFDKYPFRDTLPHNIYKLVFFRSPVTHVHSQFSMCRDSPWAIKKRTRVPNHFVVTKNFTHDYESFLNHFVRLLPSQVGPKVDFNCQDPRDTQTRHMSCDVLHNSALAHQMHSVHPANHAFNTPLDLSLAVRNLQDASYIGLVEFYSESLQMLSYKLFGDFHRLDSDVHITHGTTAFHISDGILQLLPRVHALIETDKKLYHAALLRFFCDIRQVEIASKVDKCIACDDAVAAVVENQVKLGVISDEVQQLL